VIQDAQARSVQYRVLLCQASTVSWELERSLQASDGMSNMIYKTRTLPKKGPDWSLSTMPNSKVAVPLQFVVNDVEPAIPTS